MMNSPCARLITPIWPNVNVSPKAISSSTAPMLPPITSWFSTLMAGTYLCRVRLLGEAGGPVVPLQEGVGLDRLAGVPHLLDQPVRAYHPYPGRLVEVLVVAVDRDRTLRGIQRDAGGRLADRVHIGGTGLLHRGRPQVDAVVPGLHRVGRDPVRPVLGLERLHELEVALGFRGLVVVPGHIVPRDVLRPDTGDLLLGHAHQIGRAHV